MQALPYSSATTGAWPVAERRRTRRRSHGSRYFASGRHQGQEGSLPQAGAEASNGPGERQNNRRPANRWPLGAVFGVVCAGIGGNSGDRGGIGRTVTESG